MRVKGIAETSDMVADLQGQIERITYNNEETGFTVARVKVPGRRELVTVVGSMVTPAPGEVLAMTGEWCHHPKYGEQFKLSRYKSQTPASMEGIEKYLGSGLIKGIGQVMAQRIVKLFGKQTLEVMDHHIEKLIRVEGIGHKRVEMIKASWAGQREIREVMLFLQNHGVGPGYAAKIFQQYGRQSLGVVQENPYRLASDIFGIGFITADRIAEKIGFARDSELRAEAGILYVLNQLADEGHVYYPHDPLIAKCQEILEVDQAIILRALGTLILQQKVVSEALSKAAGIGPGDHQGVYLTHFHRSETRVAARLAALIQAPKSIHSLAPENAVAWVQKQLSLSLASRQIEAVKMALGKKVMVITGGPGTGKTTIIKAILGIVGRDGVKVKLAAPTGRAAKRMSEATGYPAKTIHRLLEYSFTQGGFQKNESKHLRCDLLIIDEASMIDTILMHHLMKAIAPGTTLILVGDVNQLPSVGPGNVLNDIIASGITPVVELNEIFRQARESLIIVNAHKINQGEMPYLKHSSDKLEDFYFIEQEQPEEVLHLILELVQERIPQRFGFDPVNEIQVLSPMHKGIVGAANLNIELQRALNPHPEEVSRGGRSFRLYDKVMQISNNYDKEVFNGDIGRITRIDNENQNLSIEIDGRAILYDFTELDEIVLAYAISVHKSQGSEYPAVVLPLLTQHYMLLQRNLIYTAVTRGKKLVVIVGTRKALAIGIKNDRTRKRYTYLEYRLRG